MERAIECVPQSVAALAPLVDAVMCVENEGDEPELRTPGLTWGSVRDLFVQRCVCGLACQCRSTNSH